MARLSAWAAGAALILAAPVAAQQNASPTAPAQPTIAVGSQVGPDGFLRAVTLRELGFEAGFEFSMLSGYREVFIPVPRNAPVRAMKLRLHLRQAAALRSDRHLSLLVDDRVQRVVTLSGGDEAREIVVDVPAEARRDGFVKLGFRYGGAISEYRCMDERAAGDYLHIEPRTALELSFSQADELGVADAVALFPSKVGITLEPEGPVSDEMLAAALRAAAFYRADAGRAWVGTGSAPSETADEGAWARGLFVVAGAGGQAGATLRAEPRDGRPALVVSGPAVQDAVGALSEGLAPLASVAAGGGLSLDRAAVREGDADQVPLIPAGAASIDYVVERSFFEAGFEMADMPAGRRPAAVQIDMAVAPDPEGSGLVISAFVNDLLLGSTSTEGGERTRLVVDLPEGLVGRSNQVRVAVQRRATGGDCLIRPTGFPAQLLPSSAILLAAAEPAREFHQLIPAFRNGAILAIDPALGFDAERALAHLAPVFAALGAADAPVQVADALPEAPQLPFLQLSASAPEGSSPPLVFDRGRASLAMPDGRPWLEQAAIDQADVVQLVRVGETAGVWIRPGAGEPPGEGDVVALDRGDIAFLDAGGTALSLASDRRDLLRISYPDVFDPLRLAKRYYGWLILAAWALATVVAVLIIRRLYASSRKRE
ncbi:cellulose biosynthesis cyclic di-GMP-binding regulatory protein BcsB [uncultured Albimonas sp.]|uniref:cellulose biosynthesis cyclic di-GMP-binding regulatory protein BcsB n=1 Tax=uncultured Albimonas sp. TaxID=1331701 RepID=UPI0030EB7791|tara:strand:+ start:2383 stop:4350 length:1968 start_codon:yes stop_codon:yes gene_type:complete